MKSTFQFKGKWKKQNWIILGMVGILLMVLAVPDEKDKDMKEEAPSHKKTEDEYIIRTEKKLEDVLSQVEGVGRVSAMITMSSTSEKVIEKDTQIRRENGEKENYSSVETSVITRNDREETPYISKELSPQIEGILIVADGGNDPVVVKNIMDAVQALFPVESHKIKVMKQE